MQLREYRGQLRGYCGQAGAATAILQHIGSNHRAAQSCPQVAGHRGAAPGISNMPKVHFCCPRMPQDALICPVDSGPTGQLRASPGSLGQVRFSLGASLASHSQTRRPHSTCKIYVLWCCKTIARLLRDPNLGIYGPKAPRVESKRCDSTL